MYKAYIKPHFYQTNQMSGTFALMCNVYSNQTRRFVGRFGRLRIGGATFSTKSECGIIGDCRMRTGRALPGFALSSNAPSVKLQTSPQTSGLVCANTGRKSTGHLSARPCQGSLRECVGEAEPVVQTYTVCMGETSMWSIKICGEYNITHALLPGI